MLWHFDVSILNQIKIGWISKLNLDIELWLVI